MVDEHCLHRLYRHDGLLAGLPRWRLGKDRGIVLRDGGAIWTGSSWRSASKAQVTAALHQGRVKVLVCTDAASEGLNLQAAGAVVNFDLPWNPSKVEQRIGRIDRIGQVLDEVRIVDLYLTNSVDARVYRALAQRCSLFEEFVGAMQPVLSRAMRMLLGRKHQFNEAELAKLRFVEQTKNDPSLMEPFAEDDPVDTQDRYVAGGKDHVQTADRSLGRIRCRHKAPQRRGGRTYRTERFALRCEPKGLTEDTTPTYWMV